MKYFPLKTNIGVVVLIITLLCVSCKFTSTDSSKNDEIEEFDFSKINQIDLSEIEEEAIAQTMNFKSITWCIIEPEYLDADSIVYIPNSFYSGFHPVNSAHAILSLWNDYQNSRDETLKKIILKNLAFIEEQLTDEHYAEYCFPFDHSGIDLGNKWVSGMAQGELLGSFVRGYLLADDQHYIDVADSLFTTLMRNTINSGEYWCTYVDSANYFWIEEYPNPDKCHVLNGMQFALWGIWEYYVISQNPDAKSMFQAGLCSIIENFDDVWQSPDKPRSMYCKHFTASTTYHNIHIGKFRFFNNYFHLDVIDVIIQKLLDKPLE